MSKEYQEDVIQKDQTVQDATKQEDEAMAAVAERDELLAVPW